MEIEKIVMKSKFDLKHGIGKLVPENKDDLFLLEGIIKKGDLVKAKTLRSVEVRRGEKKEKVGKRAVVLKIEAVSYTHLTLPTKA